MRKIELVRLAYNLTLQTQEGLITAEQAKKQFKKVVKESKRQDSYKKLQAEDPNLWMLACKLRG